MNASDDTPSPWVVILAGGDGSRLRGAEIRGRLLDRPKQFCALAGPDTLLELTLKRAERITAPSRIVVLVREEHRQWWSGTLGRLPPRNVLVQPANRGTAVAIVHALLHTLQRELEPTLVFLPSDHAVDDETVLGDSIGLAARLAAGSPEHVLLLGLTPDHAETEYGWILPAACREGLVHAVARFVEKPAAPEALELLASGALWSSFIIATSASALFGLVLATQPLVLELCLECHALSQWDPNEARKRFFSLPCMDFGRDILSHAAESLRVVTVPSCGWSDLGTRERIERWLWITRDPRGMPMSPEVRALTTQSGVGAVQGMGCSAM